MYCTPLHLQKRTVYRWLAVILVMVLLFQCAIPLPGPGRWGWHERLAPWRSKRCPLGYRRYRQACWALLTCRVQVLLCRLGLVAVLLLWSGWPQR